MQGDRHELPMNCLPGFGAGTSNNHSGESTPLWTHVKKTGVYTYEWSFPGWECGNFSWPEALCKVTRKRASFQEKGLSADSCWESRQQNWEQIKSNSTLQNSKTSAKDKFVQHVKSRSHHLYNTESTCKMLVTWRCRRLFHYSNLHHLEGAKQKRSFAEEDYATGVPWTLWTPNPQTKLIPTPPLALSLESQ